KPACASCPPSSTAGSAGSGNASRAIRGSQHNVSITRALAVLAATVAAIGVVSAPAQAALTAVGPLDPTNGFPAWYQDANGLQVALCVADPGCPISPAVADFVAPAGEAFYQLASAKLSAPNGGTVTVDF